MEKTCVKCGHTHTIENITSLAECPKCGVIYSKAEARTNTVVQEDSQKVETSSNQKVERSSNRGRSIVNFLVLGVIACLFLFFYFGRNPVEKHEKLILQQTMEQRENPGSTGTIHIKPSPDNADITLTEGVAVVSETQGSNIAPYAEAPPTTIAPKETVSYYLAESTISQGEEVILNEHMSEGRFTVFFFYADW